MIQEITAFIARHWALCAAFIGVAILLLIEEVRNQGESGGKITVAKATLLMNRENALVIDLRESNAFRDGHIINAKNYPLADFARFQDKLTTQKDRAIILVDAMGLKTAAVAMQLKKAGFVHVVSLKGGMDAWKADNMPIVTEAIAKEKKKENANAKN